MKNKEILKIGLVDGRRKYPTDIDMFFYIDKEGHLPAYPISYIREELLDLVNPAIYKIATCDIHLYIASKCTIATQVAIEFLEKNGFKFKIKTPQDWGVFKSRSIIWT